ncbi:probable aspartic proteinase GIP1 [Arachis hypogaea]|uniref:probable aspartic proteinase GIP1 n=1 Tax=Arachis hypogaea TaxID=3818 RepID=UPI000DED35EB|nr:gamma conglutin 2-like [Arachis hypogaea]
MHSPLQFMITFSYFLIFFTLLSSNLTQQTTLISPVSKDKHKNLFTLSVYLKTPLRPTKLLLDLSFLFPWTVCADAASYNSSSDHYIECDETFCDYLGFGKPSLLCEDCYYSNLTTSHSQCPSPSTMICASWPANPITNVVDAGYVLVDTLALPTLNQSTHHGQLISLSNYTFSCAPSYFVKGLPTGVTGLAALGRSKLSVQSQFGSALTTSHSLAICFPGSTESTGVAFFGTHGPYFVFSKSNKIDLSKNLTYTPLIHNPIGITDDFPISPPHNEYYIGLTSIRVNGQHVPINASLLTINKEYGIGGTKITTRIPYTLLEPSIYKAFTELFIKEASSSRFNLTVTNPMKPFKVCYSAKGLMVTNKGPKVPIIDFVLDRENVVWRIMGANSMVRVKNKKVDLWCLGFMDGGVKEKTSIVMGGKQLEENLVQFDVESNRLGFFSLLTFHHSLSCADFKVTDFAKHIK